MKKDNMKTYNSHINMITLARRLVLCCIMLFSIGNAVAQDNPYVIMYGTHYLAHVKSGDVWVLQDTEDFSPACLWYSGSETNVSGTKHNYYFYEEGEYHYLGAPFEAGGIAYVSPSDPPTYTLANPDMDYYFWDWDNGMSRGHQYNGVSNAGECASCGGDWGDNQCWEVYWLEYFSSDAEHPWKLSTAHHYQKAEAISAGGHPVDVYPVTVNTHGIDVTSGSGGLASITVPATMEWSDSPLTYASLSASISSYTYAYIPAYTDYTFNGATHYYYNDSDHNIAPTAGDPVAQSPESYSWTITGDGATYLSFDATPGSNTTITTTAAPTLYYSTQNTEGHKNATVSLIVYYPSGAKQSASASVEVKTLCQNPGQ